MSEMIYYGRLSDVTVAIQNFPVDTETLVILEKVSSSKLRDQEKKDGLIFEAFNKVEEFSSWERGRIFNQTAELCWEKVAEKYQIIYIGPELETTDLSRDTSLDLMETTQKERQYYLWGRCMSKEQLDDMNWPDKEATNIFVELQTPRVLQYPAEVASGGRIKLCALEYCDRETGQTLLYRLKGVETA